MNQISFDVDEKSLGIITQITERACKLAKKHGIKLDNISTHMDITATHANGCPLRLEELLVADDANFGHDVFGIGRYLDRETGKLGGVFMPRFAKAE